MSECPSCGERFATDKVFDRHRTGPFVSEGRANATRRCLSPREMEAKGFARNAWGYWTLAKDLERTRASAGVESGSVAGAE